MTDNEKLTLMISGASAIISLLAVAVAVVSHIMNRRSTKASLLHQVKVSIDDAKSHLETRQTELAPLDAISNRTEEQERHYQSLLTIYEASFEKVLNAYEDGCQKYYAGLVLKREFRRSYSTDIRRYIEAFPDKFTGPVTGFHSMLRAYSDWHKPK